MSSQLLQRPPKRPPKTSKDSGDGAERVSQRRWGRQWGRRVLWVFVVLIAVFATGRGLKDAVSDPTVVVSTRAAAQTFPDAEATALASRFTFALLTFSPGHRDDHLASLEGLASGVLRVDSVVTVPDAGPAQRVVSTSVAATRTLGQARGTVTIAALVRREGVVTTHYVSVPVARDTSGGLVVNDFPSFVSAPAAADISVPDDEPVPIADGPAIEALLTRFLREYLRGGTVAPEFLAPDAKVVPLGHAYKLDDLVSIAQEDASTGPLRRVLAIVKVQDRATTASYTLRYRFTVARRDRWLINRLER